MTGRELQKICEEYPDYNFECSYTYPPETGDRFLNIDIFQIKGIADIGHSDKIVRLDTTIT